MWKKRRGSRHSTSRGLEIFGLNCGRTVLHCRRYIGAITDYKPLLVRAVSLHTIPCHLLLSALYWKVLSMSMAMWSQVSSLANQANFACIATYGETGYPQARIVWIDVDSCSRELLVNTESHRPLVANVERDPRASITIVDSSDPYHYAEVSARFVGQKHDHPTPEAHINRLSMKYKGHKYTLPVTSSRVILRFLPLDLFYRVPRN